MSSPGQSKPPPAPPPHPPSAPVPVSQLLKGQKASCGGPSLFAKPKSLEVPQEEHGAGLTHMTVLAIQTSGATNSVNSTCEKQYHTLQGPLIEQQGLLFLEAVQ